MATGLEMMVQFLRVALVSMAMVGCAHQAPAPAPTRLARAPEPKYYGNAQFAPQHPCPAGQAGFRLEWNQSPDYNPLIAFIQPPPARVYCASVDGVDVLLMPGATYELVGFGQTLSLRRPPDRPTH